MDKNRMTWGEAVDYLTKLNTTLCVNGKHELPTTCVMVAVISQDSFRKKYTLEERSYAFTNHNKFFIPSAVGRSIFADCLDGKDVGIRLDQHIRTLDWNVEYCYIKEEYED